MDLPKLPRQPIRPEREPGTEQEIWFPDWRCFCCHDSGRIRSSLIELIIPDYDRQRDLMGRCQHPRCEAGKDYAANFQYDQRFSPAICIELDKIERGHWKDYVHDVRAAIKVQSAIAELSAAKARLAARSKSRTENDEREIQQRKAEIEEKQ